MGTRSGGESGNCIAVVLGGHLLEQDAPPVAAFCGGDGEFEGRLAGGVAEDGGAGKEAPAQGGEFGTLRLAESALEADAEVVGADGQMTGRLGGPEGTAAETLQAELGAEFLDAVLDVGSAVVAAPHRQRAEGGRQVGAQGLGL